MDRKLADLLNAARTRQITPKEEEEQRIDFAFGNAPEGDSGTVETVRAASTILKRSAAD
jgi:hypothetical protein